MSAMVLRLAYLFTALCFAVACGDDGGGASADASTQDATPESDGGSNPGPDPSATLEVVVGASVMDVALASDGSLYLAGSLSDPYDFGEGTVTPTGDIDILLVKYTPAGELDWVKHYGGSNFNIAHAVAVDADGNVYITGYLRGTADFGGGIEGDSDTGADVFIASFTPTGAYRWADSFASDGTDIDEGQGIAVGADDVYVVGDAGRNMDFGGGSLGNLADHKYLFAASFDKDTGVHGWSVGRPYDTNFDSNPGANFHDLVIDSQERLYAAGSFRGRLDLGNGDITSSQLDGMYRTETGFVVSYGNTNGAFRWLKLQDGDNRDQTVAVATDGDDNIYATGLYTTSASLGGGTITDSEATSIPSNFFAVSYSSGGTYRFHQGGLSPSGGTAESEGVGIAVTDAGVYLSFQFRNPINVAGELLESVESDVSPGFSSQDVAIVSVDRNSGDLRWARTYGAGGDDRAGILRAFGDTVIGVMVPEGVIAIDGVSVEPQGDSTAAVVRISE